MDKKKDNCMGLKVKWNFKLFNCQILKPPKKHKPRKCFPSQLL